MKRFPVRLGALARVALAVVLVAAVALGTALYLPRTEGLSGDWSAPAATGDVVAGRALVGGGDAALDLRTGTAVRLGSVTGGTPFYADGRLLVVKGGRVDSVRLDASARWTWRAPSGHTVTPLAAGAGSTLVADCPPTASSPCRLVGLDPKGAPGWESSDARRPVDPPVGSLPRVHVELLPSGGALVTDVVSGRTSLQPGTALTAVPDGPVVTTATQGGQCVVALYVAPEPLWTRVLGPCPAGRLPEVSVRAGAVEVRSPEGTQRLAAQTGAPLPAAPRLRAAGVLATDGSLEATTRTTTRREEAFLPWSHHHVVELRDTRSHALRAQLVTDEAADVLLLEPRALVVRQGDRIVRYTLDD